MNHPQLLSILHQLGVVWPQARPLAELLPAAPDPAVLDQILALAAASLIYFRSFELPVAHSPSRRPVASPLARLQASSGPVLTTLLHTLVQFDQPPAREYLQLLDGTRSTESLAAGEEALKTFYRMGLMLA